MNIFTELQKFYVETQPHSLVDADIIFFTLALDIRKALGRQVYKFDEYLTMILRAADLYAVQRSVEEADADFSMIRKVLMELMAKKHFDKLENDYRGITDIVELRHLYRDLICAAGEQKVDQLNELIRNRFYISKAGDIYLQALTQQYLLELLNRDVESGRLIIQIICNDEMIQEENFY